ncbi:methyltransferase type 11 [Maribacter sp. 4U21]|uniref:methyltransferase domain-containing protein n=1 Tax=Maribacter sp. 4U21 TaxID=1889779 RepID=UPI000C14F709|nr:methyltransferase domain-containing protein [Maribacter sp. 4U21]PIB25402.1 methyltransferase type 11 [Maribacter sp. 4U21]
MEQLTHQWNTNLYNDKHSFVYAYGASLIDILNPKVNERILNLGCGSGELTALINERSKDVVGMDISVEMISKAKTQFPLCKFKVGDAIRFNFDAPFDAIFSNAALHWVTNYNEAITCMYLNLKKGGRIVLEFGGKDNVKKITTQLRKSLLKRGYKKQAELKLWYFPSIGEYTMVLESVGFLVSSAQWYARPTELADNKTGIKDWLQMFCKPFLVEVDNSDVIDILTEVQEFLRPDLYVDGKWFADYKRIRIVAHR